MLWKESRTWKIWKTDCLLKVWVVAYLNHSFQIAKVWNEEPENSWAKIQSQLTCDSDNKVAGKGSNLLFKTLETYFNTLKQLKDVDVT